MSLRGPHGRCVIFQLGKNLVVSSEDLPIDKARVVIALIEIRNDEPEEIHLPVIETQDRQTNIDWMAGFGRATKSPKTATKLLLVEWRLTSILGEPCVISSCQSAWWLNASYRSWLSRAAKRLLLRLGLKRETV